MKAAESGAPPATTTPMKANCEAPVNINNDSAQVCQTAQTGGDRDGAEGHGVRAGGDPDSEAVPDDCPTFGCLAVGARS